MAKRPTAELVGTSAQIESVRESLRQLADVPWPVRIEGPTGSGKSLAARVLHDSSSRRGGPFVKCSLGTIANGLEVAEFVGHARGAFTGAIGSRVGLFEAAHGGTLLLDEVGTASQVVQNALLQLVEDGSVRRVGEHKDRSVDVRLVFATNMDLEAAVSSGEFRVDLFYRLGNLVVRMPSLASRRSDIPELSKVILQQKAREAGCSAPELAKRDLDILMSYRWPGNVRQLHHVLEHFLVFGKLPIIQPCEFNDRVGWREGVPEALKLHKGNKAAAARALGVSRNTLYKELRKKRG